MGSLNNPTEGATAVLGVYTIFFQREVPDEQNRRDFLDNRYLWRLCQHLDKNRIDLSYDIYLHWADLPLNNQRETVRAKG